MTPLSDAPNWADQLSAWSELASAAGTLLALIASLVAVYFTVKTWGQLKAERQEHRDAQVYNIRVYARPLPVEVSDLPHLVKAMREENQFLLPAFCIVVDNAGPNPVRRIEVLLDRHLQTDSWREVAEGALGRREHVTDLAGHTKAYFVRAGTDGRDPHVPFQVSFDDEYGQRWVIDDKGHRTKTTTG